MTIERRVSGLEDRERQSGDRLARVETTLGTLVDAVTALRGDFDEWRQDRAEETGRTLGQAKDRERIREALRYAITVGVSAASALGVSRLWH